MENLGVDVRLIAKKQTPWPLVCKRILPTEWPPPVGEVSVIDECRVVSVAGPTAVNLGFLERNP
jgi:hypothetical protein